MKMPGDMVGLNVSRETLERLEWFESQVKKWSPAINLIATSTLADVWKRHILDSAQVFQSAPRAESWLDIGSGGGFPGLVVAILAKEHAPEMTVTLMDSDQRKCVFLRTVSRELGLKASVLAKRIEAVPPINSQVLSARALADLPTLLAYAERHLDPEGTALFQKGENWQSEVAIANEQWQFDLEVHKSKTEPRAALLKIRNILRAS